MKSLPLLALIVLTLVACTPKAIPATPVNPSPTETLAPTSRITTTPEPNIDITPGPSFVVKPPPWVTIPLPLNTIDPNAPTPTPLMYDGFVIAGENIDSVRDQFSKTGFSVVDSGTSFCIFPGQHMIQTITGYGINSVEYSLDGSETQNLVLWVTINDYTNSTTLIVPFAYVLDVQSDGSICLAFVEVIKPQPSG